MRRIFFYIILAILLISVNLFSQNPPHPNNGNNPDQWNTPVGGGSPIGGGLVILLSLGIGYSLNKIYFIRRNNKDNAIT